MSAIKVNAQYPFEFETIQVDEQGQIIERKQGRSFAFREPLADEIGLEMVAIPGGKFMMGAPESEYDRSEGGNPLNQVSARDQWEGQNPQHPVTLQPFFMGKYPITEVQWEAIANTLQIERELNPKPTEPQGDNLPVSSVSWDEAIEFCQRLSRETRRVYRLPTEAEWEYACRAGTETPFYFGPTITTDLANYRGTYHGSTEWSFSGSYNRGPTGIYRDDATPVDTFEPNAFGLYDMHGNVSEWCLDHCHLDYIGAPADGSAWIAGGFDDVRIVRGGDYTLFPYYCRSASRGTQEPDSHYTNIGFRVVCEIPRIP
jgi:formylglycine-generating enzyme required for sulfatase activity